LPPLKVSNNFWNELKLLVFKYNVVKLDFLGPVFRETGKATIGGSDIIYKNNIDNLINYRPRMKM